jgi:hypothetical protein
MTTQGWDDDDQLFDHLRAAVRHAGAPTPTMTAAGQAAFSWRTVDAELAALTYDSVAEDPALVRSTAAAPRTLVFEGAQLSVEVERTEEGLVGQLLPPTRGEVTLLGPDGELAHGSVDELGCFSFGPPPGGPVRLRCRTSAGVLLTDWVRF